VDVRDLCVELVNLGLVLHFAASLSSIAAFPQRMTRDCNSGSRIGVVCSVLG
jgi:hypothetical protein